MPLEGIGGVDFFACFYIPEFDSFVITTAHQSLAVGTKINASDTMMHLEGVDFLAFFYIPEFDSTVPTTAHQSQIGSLEINYTETFQESDRALVTAILDYYAQRHGSYQLS